MKSGGTKMSHGNSNDAVDDDPDKVHILKTIEILSSRIDEVEARMDRLENEKELRRLGEDWRVRRSRHDGDA